MNKKEFNLSFLAALDFINPRVKLIGEGTAGKHPNLRRALLRAVKQDIKQDGLDTTCRRWQHFIKPSVSLSNQNLGA